MRSRSSAAGFTLAELLVVIAILGILALCIVRATKGATDRADVVRCMGNMRGIHLALISTVTEEGQWPQCPHRVGDTGFDEWWIKKMARYKIDMANWSCPTMVRMTAKQEKANSSQAKIHYVPTPFDDKASTPYKWKRQPWLIEVADMHGEGNLICFPDGAIIGSSRYLAGKM